VHGPSKYGGKVLKSFSTDAERQIREALHGSGVQRGASEPVPAGAQA